MKKLLPYFLVSLIITACDSKSGNEQDQDNDSITTTENQRTDGAEVEGLEVVEVQPIEYIGMETSVRRNELQFLGNTVTEVYGKITEQVEGEYAPDTINAMSVYQSIGTDSVQLLIAMQLPQNDSTQRENTDTNQFGSTDGGHAVRGIHKGSYRNLLQTHSKIVQYIEEENLKMNGDPYEIYKTGPSQQEADTASWVTEIYYPVHDNGLL